MHLRLVASAYRVQLGAAPTLQIPDNCVLLHQLQHPSMAGEADASLNPSHLQRGLLINSRRAPTPQPTRQRGGYRAFKYVCATTKTLRNFGD